MESNARAPLASGRHTVRRGGDVAYSDVEGDTGQGQGLGARGGAISLGSTSPLEARGRQCQVVSQSVVSAGQLVSESVEVSVGPLAHCISRRRAVAVAIIKFDYNCKIV